jgi:hypothetical protein
VTVIQVIRASAPDTKRDPRISWFVFVGQQLPPLSEIPTLYSGRYSIEHGYRVDKQDLLWERVGLRTPEQFERFTQVVACVRQPVCAKSVENPLVEPRELKSPLRPVMR